MGAPIPACVLPPSGPAASGQPRPSMANGAWRGNLSQTAIDRKPLQTDKLTGRAFDDEVYAVVAQIPAGKIVSYKQIARLIGMPDHARRVGRAMASAPAGLPCHRVVNSAGAPPPAGPGSGSCSKRKASASRPTAAPTSPASCGRKSCKPHGTHTWHSRGEHREPRREGHLPHPAGYDRPQAAATYRRKNLAFRTKTVIFASSRIRSGAYCGGQYSPPGMRLSGKSTA